MQTNGPALQEPNTRAITTNPAQLRSTLVGGYANSQTTVTANLKKNNTIQLVIPQKN